MTPDPDILAPYGAALGDYLQAEGEEALYRASLCSGTFIEHGLGPEEIVALHSEEVERLTSSAPLRDRARKYASSMQFLLEVMIAYGVRYKEYTDLKLTESQRDVESRMAFERALAEERIRAQEESLRSKEEFLRFIAHELRTPLTAIKGQLQLLQRRRTDPERLDRSLDQMAHAVQALTRLTGNLLDSGRSEADAAQADAAGEVDFAQAVRAIMEELAAYAEQCGVVLVFAADADLPPIRADHMALESILANLLGNAIKYSPQGGRVQVALSSDAATVRCGITDEGIGIPPADLPHIFEKYYRAANSGSVQGVGLGLSVAKATAERLGGRLDVVSRKEQAPRSPCIFPAATADDAAPASTPLTILLNFWEHPKPI